jgi:hypothetical protein
MEMAVSSSRKTPLTVIDELMTPSGQSQKGLATGPQRRMTSPAAVIKRQLTGVGAWHGKGN